MGGLKTTKFDDNNSNKKKKKNLRRYKNFKEV